MSKDTGHQIPDQPESWRWPEEKWREIVNKIRAGRSMKPKNWPNDAKVAVALSFDSDHETQTLRWGHHSPGKLSQGEYGNRVGVPRVLEILKKYNAPSTFFVPAVIAMLYPDEQKRVIAEGHEVAIHSWIHELNSALAPEDERELQMRSADKLEEITGVRPVGIRTPSWDFSQHTMEITREMGLIYDSSLMADDEPYEILENGIEIKKAIKVLELACAEDFADVKNELSTALLMYTISDTDCLFINSSPQYTLMYVFAHPAGPGTNTILVFLSSAMLINCFCLSVNSL